MPEAERLSAGRCGEEGEEGREELAERLAMVRIQQGCSVRLIQNGFG